MYTVERVAGGYQVWHQEENRPVDDQFIYPSRQNAYVRRDQLNEQPRGRVFGITLRLERKDCNTAIEKIGAILGKGIELYVVDPLSEVVPEVRDVTFSYRCAAPLPEAQIQRHRFSRRYPPLTESELLTTLEDVAESLPIVNSVSISPT